MLSTGFFVPTTDRRASPNKDALIDLARESIAIYETYAESHRGKVGADGLVHDPSPQGGQAERQANGLRHASIMSFMIGLDCRPG